MREAKEARREVILSIVTELVDALETANLPIEKSLMKAMRLARVMRDPDAQTWIQHEIQGYPKQDKLMSQKLGNCAKYALRFYANGELDPASLPQIEADVHATKVVMEKIQVPAPRESVANFLESRATNDVIDHAMTALTNARTAHTNAVHRFHRLVGSLHQWASDVLISLEFDGVTETMFEESRRQVEEFVRIACPKAAHQLVAAEERLANGDPESLSAALTSCRRLFMSVADAVFPATDQPYVDGSGKKRKVDEGSYKNRLLAFFEGATKSDSTKAMLSAQLEQTAARVDAAYDLSCKGVHADVDSSEARLAMMETYLLIAEVARLARQQGALANRSDVGPTNPSGPSSKPAA
ncbi:MAG: hypothetical protein JST54_29185 [Deltaproteobacteria bacterium]|nr:hypothetical protein [Deltaproteobacteria bacterium]